MFGVSHIAVFADFITSGIFSLQKTQKVEEMELYFQF